MQTALNGGVKVGSFLSNNDPRVTGDKKIVRVTRVTSQYAFYKTAKRQQSVKLDRIYTDNGARHQGYNVVPEPASLADTIAGYAD